MVLSELAVVVGHRDRATDKFSPEKPLTVAYIV